MKTSITAVIPIRNRSGVRVENCLRSLRWQEGVDDFEIVLGDLGSTGKHKASLLELCETYDARFVSLPHDDLWNRSLALNTGIRAARGEYVFCTDADMIFKPNFLASALEAQAQANGRAMVLCRCHDLPPYVPEKLWEQSDFPMLERSSHVRRTSGVGACQVAPRSFFEEVHGYDEKFVFWGSEDVDMTSRAERYGLELTWMSDRTVMLHQWHKTLKRDMPLQYHINRWRFKLTKRVVVKNRQGWGGAPC